MDKELAQAVFGRWEGGLPVAETMFHKAASVLGINPDDALLEARFYTALDHDLAKVASGDSLDDASLRIYAAAAGISGHEKVANIAARHYVDPVKLVFEKLAHRDWVPDLDLLKTALMADAGMMDPAMAQDPGMIMGGQGGQPPMMPPQPGAAVQQAPMRRYKPSPMAPLQTPPSSEGNLQELVEAARYPDDAMAEAGAGGMGPQGAAMGGTDMGPEAPPQLPPDQKLLQVQPDLPPDKVERYAAKLQELEQQVGMSVEDPGQVQKFLQQMQKEDAKVIDQAIKQIGAAPTKFGPEGSTVTGATPKQPAEAQPAPEGGGEEQQKVASRRRVFLP